MLIIGLKFINLQLTNNEIQLARCISRIDYSYLNMCSLAIWSTIRNLSNMNDVGQLLQFKRSLGVLSPDLIEVV